MARRKPAMDEVLAAEVTAALTNDVRLDESAINIDVVGGTVYLTGIVPSLFQKRTAREIAGRIKGVLDVDNELRVTPEVVRNDEDIANDIRNAWRRDPWIDEQRIDVVVDQGIVHISGTVDDGQEKAAAGDDAWTVPAVLDVINDLAIAPHVFRTDEEIANELRIDLERNIRLQPQRVHVSVRDGVVYLDGTVDNIQQRWLSEDLARWIPGVIDVVNHLAIEGP